MRRALRNLFRLLAASLIVFGGLGFGLEFLRQRLRDAEIRWSYIAIGAVLLVSGVILFWASARLAERWADDIDDGDS